ncbi:MAG: LuxR C-terminal-related transcriptional regulator [Phormidesmis sp.]
MKTANSTPDFSILRAALEGLPDGFIIADRTGEIEKINTSAKRICNLLSPADNQLPIEIWRMCKSAIAAQNALSLENTRIDADIILPIGTVRIRVQNIHLTQTPYLLIVLEDRQQTLHNKALSDAALLGLTKRETEVWQLKLCGADYNEISTKLWISLNTVKKHIKNIHAKQRSHEDDGKYALMA